MYNEFIHTGTVYIQYARARTYADTDTRNKIKKQSVVVKINLRAHTGSTQHARGHTAHRHHTRTHIHTHTHTHTVITQTLATHNKK